MNLFTQNRRTKRRTFTVLNQPKCIANLCTSPMHFKWRFECYQTSSVIKVVVLNSKPFQSDSMQIFIIAFLLGCMTLCFIINWSSLIVLIFDDSFSEIMLKAVILKALAFSSYVDIFRSINASLILHLRM